MDEPLETIDRARNTLVDLAIQFGPKLLAAILVLGAGVLFARWVGTGVLRALQHVEMEPPVRMLLMRIARVLVFGLFVIMALQNIGVQLLPLIAGLGVAGAGIALALQGVLTNAAAGLTIIFTRPFRVGEYISIIGEEGRVESVTLFSTTLSHPDLSYVVVPNRKIVGEVLHNYGKLRQLDIVVPVAHDTNLDEALAAVREVLDRNPRVLRDPEPLVRAAAIGTSAVNIAVKPWVPVPDYVVAGGEITKAIAEVFHTRGIVIPVQQHEVRLVGGSS